MVLHLGNGGHPLDCPAFEGLREVSLDAVRGASHVCGDVRAIPFAEDAFQGVFSCHLLEHLTPSGLGECLAECFRVLDGDGLFIARVPDFERACAMVAAGLESEPVYWSAAGFMYPRDLIFGWSGYQDPYPYMRHLNGITPRVIRKALADAGFIDIRVARVEAMMEIEAVARKPVAH